MERSSFGARARHRIWQDTLTAVKSRAVPFIIGVFALVIGFLTNVFWLHATTAKQIAILGAVSLGGSYAAWFFCVLVVNTVRVPWLLDAESTNLINMQEARAEAAEKKIAEIKSATDKHDLFGKLMQQGVDFSSQLATCQSPEQFASWDRGFDEWLKAVQQAMGDMGFPTDAVEFARAAEYAEPVRGIITAGTKREERARVLEKHQEYLADFVQRRLP